MKHRDGYTLIELLLYISIMGILLGALTSLLSVSLSARIKNESIIEVDRQGEFMIDTIAQTARAAASITTPAGGASGSTLTLGMATAGVNPTTFNVAGTTLQIKEGAGATIPLNSGRVAVTGFTVKNLSRASTPGAVQISFTLSTVNTTGRNEYDYQKTFTTSASLR
jgi:type II secretory pathway pseudopilin PulG